jgi:hypothetical protein
MRIGKHVCNMHAVLYDLNGREADEAELILGALGGNVDQYIFCSSAGVYLKSHMMPHHESDAGDPKSRHKASLEITYLLLFYFICSSFPQLRCTREAARPSVSCCLVAKPR